MVQKSHQEDTGVKLEVNECILGTCTGLMRAIQVLIQQAKVLQGEIVCEGMVSEAVAMTLHLISPYPTGWALLCQRVLQEELPVV